MKKELRNWQRNLKAISDLNIELAKILKEPSCCDWISPIRSRNGEPNLLIKRGSEITAAYDMENPSEEAKKAAEKTKLHKQDVSVIIGLGLGYFVDATFKHAEEGHRVVVVEPSIELIKMAFRTFDFSKYISQKRFFIVTNAEQASLVLQILAAEFVIEGWMMTTINYTQHRPEEYNEIISIVGKNLNQILCNTGTIAGAAGGIIADNDISCLPYVIRHRGVAELKNLFKDKPAVLVSTGPSLARNIHHLIEAKDKVVIIAVGQALRVLLAYGIKPDFITTVDFGEVNYVHFKGLMNADVPLVSINRTYAPLLRDWHGPKFIAATPVPGFEEKATGILSNKGFIEAGGSVAHMSLGLAHLLGCNPICFIGQDLALGETSHIPLADAMGKIGVTEDGQIIWKVDDQRCHLSKDNAAHGMGIMHFVPGYWGKPVLTNLGLASFLTVFESMVKNYTVKNIFNCTEGGARIKGAKQMLLKNYIEEYCSEKIDKSIVDPLLTFAKDGDKLIEKVIPLLQHDIDILKLIIKNSKIAMASNKGTKFILGKLDSSKKKKKLITSNIQHMMERISKDALKQGGNDIFMTNQIFYETLIKDLKDSKNTELKALVKLSKINYFYSESTAVVARSNPLVNVAIYGASRSIQSRKLKVSGSLLTFFKDREIANTRIERNNIILTAAKKASESLIKSYEKTLELLKEYDKTKDNSLLQPIVDEEINFDDVEQYFSNGNWAHPLVDSERVIKGGVHTNLIFFKKAKDIYGTATKMRQEAIQKAQDYERENSERESKILKHNFLIEESQEAGKKLDFQKALSLIKEALELIPDSLDAQWGLASCYNQTGEYEKSIQEYRKLINMQPSDQPENPRYRFEMGQVMLQITETVFDGLKEISESMKLTTEFDSFLTRIGQIYLHLEMPKEALQAFDSYLEKFPFDINTLEKKQNCLILLGMKDEAKEVSQKINQISQK